MTPAARKARAVRALQSLPGIAALHGVAERPQVGDDNDLVRAGLARRVNGGFELTPKGFAFLERALR